MSGEGRTIKIYKKAGETPLERLDRLRKEEPIFADKKLSYAGRLDPMAEGVMLVLVGDANKEREKYLKYSKEYTFEVLFGFATDSYDLLGLVTNYIKSSDNQGPSLDFIEDLGKIVKKLLKEFEGELEQEYPPFSSKTVDGKPLFEWAREGKLDEIEIPTNKVIIHKIEMIDKRTIDKSDLRREILQRIMRVKGDFRQKEILDRWDKVLKKTKIEKFPVLKFNSFVSSGTYIRGIANQVGEKLNIPALAYTIKRNSIEE